MAVQFVHGFHNRRNMVEEGPVASAQVVESGLAGGRLQKAVFPGSVSNDIAGF